MSLPAGWVEVSLADALSQLRTGPFGSSVHKHDYIRGGIPLINPMHILHNRVEPSETVSLTHEKSAELSDFKLKVSDVILGRRGEMGRCAVIGEREAGWLIGTGSMALSPSPALDSNYLQTFLTSDAVVKALEGSAVGTTMVNLNQSILLSLPLPLPPLAEQRRIVAKLDALTARLARARAELDRVPLLAERLRETALSDAFEGRLYAEGAGDKGSWTIVPFHQAAEIASNLVPPQTISTLPHIAPNHIRSGTPLLLPYRTIGEDAVISGKHHFYPGQIIYSKIRPNLRKVVLVDFEGGCSADMYPINAKCHPRYLLYWMLSPQFTWLATSQDGRTVLPKINQNALNAIPTPLPPTAVQTRISEALDAIFARADRMEAEARKARALLDRLESALLARAFRGELVPQNPADEPASVLLDRIRTQRAAAPKPKRGRKAKTS